MGEYGREQRNQLSMTIGNNKKKDKQLKGITDNRYQTLNQLKINELNDINLYDSDIYGIYDVQSSNKGNIIYVGQTNQGVVKRFQQHATDSKESNQPWHINHYTYDQYDSSKWRFVPSYIYTCKQFTPLEITASEEFFYEHYDGLSGKLYNRQQPLRKDTFLKYKTAATFRPTRCYFDANWTPKQ